MVQTRSIRSSRWGDGRLAALLDRRPNHIGLRTIPFGNSIMTATYPFANEAVWQTSPALLWIGNAGLAGDNTAEMLARVGTAIPDTAQAVLIMEGANDAADAVSTAQHYANLSAIIDNLIGRGITPALLATSPKDGSEATITAYHAAEHALAMDRNVSIFDPWLDNVDTADGGWVSGHTSDGTHPVDAQAMVAAANLAAQVLGTDPTPPFAPRSNAAGVAGYCLAGGNCFMLTDTNADGAPDGWSLIGGTPGTPSNPAAPAGFKGKMARLTANNAGGFPYLRKQIAASGKFAAGDELLVSFVVATDVGASPAQAYITARVDGASVELIKQGHMLDLAGQRFYAYLTPTTTTTIDFNVAINNSATGHYIEVGEFEVYNLTAMRAAV